MLPSPLSAQRRSFGNSLNATKSGLAVTVKGGLSARRSLVYTLAMAKEEEPRAAWQGRLHLGNRYAVWRGDIGEGAVHRHFAAQAIISNRPVRVFDAQGHAVQAECVLVDPLTPHRVEPSSEALLVYVEPGKWIEPCAEETLLPARSTNSLAMLTSPHGGRFWANWLTTPPAGSDPIDPRLASALEYIEAVLALGPVPLKAAAARGALSPDHFRHLFVQQMGLAYKRYVLWRRLRLATTELMNGHDVTTAAHAAGFSDSAHFARTLKATFGISASQALAGQHTKPSTSPYRVGSRHMG